jgi:cytoskeletal protein CcmA (bactofilin family)
LDIGEGAVVKANINVHSVYVGGDVEGKVDVKDKLNIHATGRLTGDVSTPVFIMEEGALFEGTSRMKDLKEKKNIVRVVD